MLLPGLGLIGWIEVVQGVWRYARKRGLEFRRYGGKAPLGNGRDIYWSLNNQLLSGIDHLQEGGLVRTMLGILLTYRLWAEVLCISSRLKHLRAIVEISGLLPLWLQSWEPHDKIKAAWTPESLHEGQLHWGVPQQALEFGFNHWDAEVNLLS